MFSKSVFFLRRHFTSLLPVVQDKYYPSHLPNSIFILECVTAVFAVQHLILLVVLYRFKPPNMDYFEYDRVETMETSQPASPPYQDIGKPTLCLLAPSPMQVRVEGEESVPLYRLLSCHRCLVLCIVFFSSNKLLFSPDLSLRLAMRKKERDREMSMVGQTETFLRRPKTDGIYRSSVDATGPLV